MVVRSKPSAAVLGYYDSIISGMTASSSSDGAGLDGDHRTRRRYHVIFAENSPKFPDSMSLAQLVYFSPGCLNQIRGIVQDRPSYIVPGIAGTYEKQLCTCLGIPLLANDPSMHPQHCNKISARKLFMSVGAVVPCGTYLAPLTTTYQESKRIAEFERLKRKAMLRLSSLNVKRRRAFKRLDAALAVNHLTESQHDASTAAQEEAEFLEDIPGVFLSIDLAVEQTHPDLVGLWLTIAHAMMNNLQTQRWLLKIADQTEGRGQAVIRSADFQGLRTAIEQRRRWGYKLAGSSIPRNAILDFAAELAIELPRLVRISGSATACYGDWDHYFHSMIRAGAVLEAMPATPQAKVIGCSASLVIEPPSSLDGTGDNWKLLQLIERRSVVDDDTIHGDGPSLWLFPLGCQDGMPSSAGHARRKAAAVRTAQARRAAMRMTKLCSLVAPELARRGVRGYVTIDAVAFNDAPAPQHRIHVRNIGVDGWDGSEQGIGLYESEEAITKLFADFGQVLSVLVRHRIEAGENTSWAVVTMASAEEVEAALQAHASVGIMAGETVLELNPFDVSQAHASTGAMANVRADLELQGKSSCPLTPEDSDDYDNRPITPVPDVRASVELWATDICYGYTDRVVSWEVAHAILQGAYLPGAGVYSVRSGSMQRCMAGCRIISPRVDKILGGRGGGLMSFFRWANISEQRHLMDKEHRDGAAAAPVRASPSLDADRLGCQYDISEQLGGLFGLPPCGMMDDVSTGNRRSHRRSLLRKPEIPEAMGLTLVGADTASCWAMLRNTLQWLERTSINGPAREVAQIRTGSSVATSPRPPQAHSARALGAPVERREEEDNLHSLLRLATAVAL